MSLVESRTLFIRAVRGYIFTGSLADVYCYAGDRHELRREVIKFAAWVRKNGEPKWFKTAKVERQQDLPL